MSSSLSKLSNTNNTFEYCSRLFDSKYTFPINFSEEFIGYYNRIIKLVCFL